MTAKRTRPTKPPSPPPAPSRPARVLLVDDHPLVREGLARVIGGTADLMVCGEAVNNHQAQQAVETLKPDLAIVDVSLDGSHGIELVKDLKARYPELKMLVLSMHDESLYAERALRAGAKGYLMKREPPEKLLQAVRKILRGEVWCSESFTARMLGRLASPRGESESLPTGRLSDRELEVLELIGQGQKTQRIADQLHLSVKTIQTYREHIKEKLGLPDGASLTRFAVQWVESEKEV